MNSKNDNRNQPNQYNEIPSGRLFDILDVVLQAHAELAAQFGPAAPLPSDSMGTDAQPASLCQFTRDEVEQATRLAIRMGLIARVPAR